MSGIKIGLVRVFTTGHLVVLGISAMVGSGILVLTGLVAGAHASPAVMLSFLLRGIVCMFVALCYSELASTMPKAGGLYSYIASLFLSQMALFFGIIIITSTLFSMSGVVIGAAGYVWNFLAATGVSSSINLQKIVISLGDLHITLNLTAFCLITLIAAILLRSNKSSVYVAFLLVGVKLLIIIIFISAALMNTDIAHWQPFIPDKLGEYEKFGISVVVTGVSMLTLSYSGFESIGAAAQEVHDPCKVLLKAIIISFVFCVTIYIYMLMSLAVTGIVHYSELNVLNPIAVMFKVIDFQLLEPLVLLGIVFSLISVMLAVVFGLSRVLYAIAKDGMLPQILTKCNKIGTPYISVIALTTVLAIISTVMPTHILVPIASFGYITMFITICSLVLVLRKKQISLGFTTTYFKCPFVPFIQIVTILLLIQMWFTLLLNCFVYIMLWLVIILCSYFVLLFRMSNL